MFDLLRQAFSLSQKQELAYEISGVLHGKDRRLPFDNSGVLFDKSLLSESPAP